MDILAITMWLDGRRGRSAVNGKVTYSKAAGRALEDWTQVLVHVNSLDPEKNAVIVGDSLVVHQKSSENINCLYRPPRLLHIIFVPSMERWPQEEGMAEHIPVLGWKKKSKLQTAKKCNHHSPPGTINAGGQKRHTANQLNELLIWYNNWFL